MWTSVKQAAQIVALTPRVLTPYPALPASVNPATKEMASHATVSQFQRIFTIHLIMHREVVLTG